MKCPHCLENFFPYFQRSDVNAGVGPKECRPMDRDGTRSIAATACPACERVVIYLNRKDQYGKSAPALLIWPRAVARAPLPAEVSEKFANDYREACLVLNDSPKASAALSRRCLQHLLREAAKTTKRDLADQISEVISKLPSHLAEAVDAVRNIGNFAAHVTKSTNTGEIVDVEPGEGMELRCLGRSV